ncbi:hypothetical protein NP493_1535g01003 [Ridgeia piscesae]|uniref:Uncharacterized protein n=1 Tax=Ridgeia piscesae TaxID=27915 RepID=A0AAD9K0J2_RIDPI|nr:hypothetical protein NP493_1535g01003 [Ridgeia piscesae]
MTMRLPLSKEDNFATITSVYAPTMTNPDENKEAFYNQLASVLSGIPHTYKLLLIGGFNAKIGKENDKWPLVMGTHRRMAKESATFGQLRQRLWNNHHVSMPVKGKIYRATVLSTLVYMEPRPGQCTADRLPRQVLYPQRLLVTEREGALVSGSKKPEDERHKDRLMDITVTAQKIN